MGIQIEGLNIRDEAEARAYQAQGFISFDEFREALQKLNPAQKIDLYRLTDMSDRNRGLWKTILQGLHIIKRD